MLIWVVIFIKIHYFMFKTCLYHQTHAMNFYFRGKNIILFQGKTNVFRYDFVAINSLFFIVVNETVVQLVLSERKWKSEATVKNSLTNNSKKMVDPTRKIFQLNQCWICIYVNQWIISIYSLINLYNSLHYSLPLSLTLFITTYWENLSLSFAFEGLILSLNDKHKFYHQWSKM